MNFYYKFENFLQMAVVAVILIAAWVGGGGGGKLKVGASSSLSYK